MKPIKRLIYGFLAASLVLSTTSCGEFIDIFSEGSSGDFEAPDELGDVELPEDATNDFEAPDFPVSTEGFQAPLSEVMLQKGSDQSGQIDQDNDMQVISAEYEVRVTYSHH